MSRPKTVFEPYTDPQNSLLQGIKVKNDPKIKSKSKVITNLTHFGPKKLFLNYLKTCYLTLICRPYSASRSCFFGLDSL